MAGHSKWAKIHRKKGLADIQKSKVFSKISKEIMIAAKGTNGVIAENPSLRVVVEKARAANMPKDNIQKAIDKVVKDNLDANFDELRYEGYGPFGSAFIIDCLTDNKNRTASEVRSAFTKNGGNLGGSGSVAFMFERRGVLTFEYKNDFDEIMMLLIDYGAIDYEKDEDEITVYTEIDKLLDVKEALINEGVNFFMTSELRFISLNPLNNLSNDEAEAIMKLQDALLDLDDVNDVYTNL